MPEPAELLKTLAKNIGIDEPVFSQNLTGIQFDKSTVYFRIDTDGWDIDMFTELGNIPADDAWRLPIYSCLLRTNLLGNETGGGILAVDAAEQTIVFSRTISTEGMEAEHFSRVLEVFLNLAEALGAKLAEIMPLTPAASDPIPSGGIRA